MIIRKIPGRTGYPGRWTTGWINRIMTKLKPKFLRLDKNLFNTHLPHEHPSLEEK
jgi:hypothetical protein